MVPPPRAGTTPVPGLLLAGAATVLAVLLSRLLPAVSPLVLALVLGAVLGSATGSSAHSVAGSCAEPSAGAARAAQDGPRGPLRSRLRGRARDLQVRTAPGTRWAATHLLRAGVVLLGLQLSLPEVLGLGWRGLVVVATTVVVTFAATLGIGRALRVPRATTLLVATGFSICGAAAVSAMQGVVERRSPARSPRPAQVLGVPDPAPARPGGPGTGGEAVATALALVTVYGSIAIVALPWAARAIGLDAARTGLWIGASVQEVAQVVTAAGSVSAVALATATVSKLARVVLLAPLVAGAGAVVARRERRAGGSVRGARARRAEPPVPGFVVGFLLAVCVRSVGIVPASWIDAAAVVTTVLLTAAMFAMGLGIDVPHLVRTGRRALLLGALAALVVSGVSLAAVLLLA